MNRNDWLEYYHSTRQALTTLLAIKSPCQHTVSYQKAAEEQNENEKSWSISMNQLIDKLHYMGRLDLLLKNRFLIIVADC